MNELIRQTRAEQSERKKQDRIGFVVTKTAVGFSYRFVTLLNKRRVKQMKCA